jgi:hypothetical protein
MKRKNKTLLKEAQIRRMMGLAGIPAIKEGEFIDSYRKQFTEEEEELPAEEDPMAAADPAAEELPVEEPVEGEPALDAAAPADEANVEELVQAIATAITDTTGVEVDAGGAGAEDPLAGGEELPAEDPLAGGEEELPPEAGAEEEEEELPMQEANLAKALAAAGIQLNLDNEELVAEVTKRVAARLVREARKVKESKRPRRRRSAKK